MDQHVLKLHKIDQVYETRPYFKDPHWIKVFFINFDQLRLTQNVFSGKSTDRQTNGQTDRLTEGPVQPSALSPSFPVLCGR